MTPQAAADTLAEFDAMDSVLGLIRFGRQKPSDTLPPEVEARVKARAEARASKDWAGSDRLRDELAAMGWEIRDSKEGQKVKKL
jgi:cysteinyl-tRNA synthetase